MPCTSNVFIAFHLESARTRKKNTYFVCLVLTSVLASQAALSGLTHWDLL